MYINFGGKITGNRNSHSKTYKFLYLCSQFTKKIRLKKAVALALLFFILFNSMGYYILFELDKMIVRKEMNALTLRTTTKLVCLKIEDAEHNPSFHRRGDKEIEFDGRLYDVVREINKGKAKLIFCIRDTKEEQLYSGLKRINHNKQRTNLWDHMVQLALPEGAMTLELISPGILKFPFLKIQLLSSFLPTWSPPPKNS